ncbi:MAG TPA: hypothetical protein VMF30_07175 [Pirellulales bacterium]|nr:hypothetical protein [Pirellulales bacterium]
MATRVNLLLLMEHAARECETKGLSTGFQIANLALARIAERACKLGDKALCEYLYSIGYVDADGQPLQPAWIADERVEAASGGKKSGGR